MQWRATAEVAVDLRFSWGWYFLALLGVMALSLGLTALRAGEANRKKRDKRPDK